MSEVLLVGIVLGSRSDYSVMRPAEEILSHFGVAHEVRVCRRTVRRTC